MRKGEKCMKRTHLFRGLFFLGVGALVLALAACPNPVNTDFALEEGDGEFEIAHSRGSYIAVESEFFPSSKYLRNALRDFLGWTFTPTAKSKDGRLVVGDAVNLGGYSDGDIRIEPGTKAAVYWVVGTSRRGRSPWISKPRVIGVVDRDSLEGNWRARWKMMWKLNSRYGLHHLDRYSIHLETAASVADLDDQYSYDVTGAIGTVTYVATFERLKVKAIAASFSDANDITSFSFAAADNPFDEDVTALIDGNLITATLPIGPDFRITPTIVIPETATITPQSGISQDFTIPVSYTVTAESGLEAVYTVSVTFDPPQGGGPGGVLVGWGYNSAGQATPPDGNDYIVIAAGEYHGLALKSDGSIVGWGNNTAGQATPPAGNDYVGITAGYQHSLALKSDGSIVGWGNSGSGQITPPAGNDYVAITAGPDHGLALKSDGSIVGWGDDTYGQATPPAGNDYVAITAGPNHGLALKSDGSIVGWGDDTYGQATPPAGNDYVAIAAGGSHGLALKTDGAIVGWGYNTEGQATPPAGKVYVAIAAGSYYSLALNVDGLIVGWGDDSDGQATPPTNDGYIAISAGLAHGLAIGF
jgi:hypothetical protein